MVRKVTGRFPKGNGVFPKWELTIPSRGTNCSLLGNKW